MTLLASDFALRLRSSVWDLGDRLSEVGMHDPRLRRLKRRILGPPKHRASVALYFSTPGEEGLDALPRKGRVPVYVAGCGCSWHEFCSDEEAAFTAAAAHTPCVRPTVLAEKPLETSELPLG